MRHKAHRGVKASWSLEAHLRHGFFLSEVHHMSNIYYDSYDGCFLFLHDFLAISWLI